MVNGPIGTDQIAAAGYSGSRGSLKTVAMLCIAMPLRAADTV